MFRTLLTSRQRRRHSHFLKSPIKIPELLTIWNGSRYFLVMVEGTDRVESWWFFFQVPPLLWKYNIGLKGEFTVVSDARLDYCALLLQVLDNMGEWVKGENLRKSRKPKRSILCFELYLWLELFRRFKRVLSELHVMLILGKCQGLRIIKLIYSSEEYSNNATRNFLHNLITWITLRLTRKLD